MKLLNKTSLIIITLALFIFFIGGISFYKIIQSMIIKQVDRELVNQQHNITYELSSFQNLDNVILITENKINIQRMDSDFHIDEMFKDTVLYDKQEKLYVPYRLFRFHRIIGENNFKISVYRSMLEAENLIEKIVITMTLMLLTLILSMFFFKPLFFPKDLGRLFLRSE